jgi:D-3-phosphoglycerate dehydrogenase
MRVCVSTSSFATYSREPFELLERAGCEIIVNPKGRALSAEEIVNLAKDCDGLLAGTEPLSAEVLARLPNLRAIARCGVGMDNVDLAAAEARGISVTSTPYGPTRAVAELTVGLMLDLMREVTRMDRELRGGAWKKRMGFLLEGKRVGLVGFGRIGRAVAELLKPFGVQIAYADPNTRDEAYLRVELDELLAWADIVSLHCAMSAKSCPLLDAERLRHMKPGAWLVNACRGGLVDEEALYELLASGHLAGAAMDCYVREPYAGPLTGLPNVILLPHVGSYAREGRTRMELDAAENLLASLGVRA